MIVGIDGNEANVEKRVGVNTYSFEVLKAIKKLQDDGICRDSIVVFLKEKPLPDLPGESINFKYTVIPGKGFWIITKLMPFLFFGGQKLDVFFSPSHYLPPFCPVPMIVSIMDLGYLEFSSQFTLVDFWQLKIWSAMSIFVSKAIIAISNSTKDDIVRHYPSAKEKIYAVPLAYDSSSFNDHISEKDVRRIKNKYSIVDDYVLYLGTLKPSKNIEGLLTAFQAVITKKIKLVIAGKKGWLFEPVFDKVKKLALTEKVIFTDFVPEKDKPALIKGAKVFVLPSFWEGFGLDVLNAMASGVPVVASDRGSLPEVMGAAGILVNPDKPEDIARGITKVLSMGKTEYNIMVGRGLSQAKKFSWEKTAGSILEICSKTKQAGN